MVSSARTDEVLKVIVANPAMIEAYKAGVPGNGQPFPEGSKIAKLQWSFKKSTEAPFVVDVPDAPTQAFVIEKDSKRFPNTGGWGYALFNHDVCGRHDDGRRGQSRLRALMPCGGEEQGLHLPLVPAAVNAMTIVRNRKRFRHSGVADTTRRERRPLHPTVHRPIFRRCNRRPSPAHQRHEVARARNGHRFIARRAAGDDAGARPLLGDRLRLAQSGGATQRLAAVHHRKSMAWTFISFTFVLSMKMRCR